MIDLKTNRLEWLTTQPGEGAAVDVLGEWDQPPDFRNVTVAIGAAMTRAQKFLLADFFEGGEK